MDHTEGDLVISVRRVIRVLMLTVILLVGLDLAALAFTMVTGHDHVMGLLPIVDLDKEHNLGTLFSAILLAANAILFFLVGMAKGPGSPGRRTWTFLGGVFLFLSFDEYAYVHERLILPMRELVGNTPILHFAWIVPYALLTLILAVAVAPTIFRVPPHPRRWLFLSAGAYLTGALGLEALDGWWLVRIGGPEARPELVYELLTTVEESLEMLGLVLLTFALLELIRIDVGPRPMRLGE